MQHFIELISSNTGLHIREQDRESVYKKNYARMKALKISVADEYYQLLKSTNYQSNLPTQTIGEREWRELIPSRVQMCHFELFLELLLSSFWSCS